MAYNIAWHEGVYKDLEKLDKPLRKKIIDRIKEYLIEDPENIGKPLTGQFAGLYRYRYGDYRVIYAIDKTEKVIKVLEIKHRKEVYK